MELDRTMPEVPMSVFCLSEEDPDFAYYERCGELWALVCDEVKDETYLRRSHHNTGTYDQGCRGPLCRKAIRENPRRRSAPVTAYALREERIFDPVLEYFHTVAKYRIKNLQRQILKEIS